ELPGGGSVAQGMLAVGSESKWKDFQAGIDVKVPILEKLGITPSQYLSLLMSRMRNDVPRNS
ncbi:hypothetical protein, partial [Streptococcus pseudopneumoniae]|uniref:hypothetical protein n=1 Tax=Streptococcus pseudopneumoniae TaxID=257758 RepID=UPI0019D4F4DE